MQIYNSLTRKKEEFTPIEDNHIRMYVCGITVYDLCHIGHARSMVLSDVIVRYFRHRGYKVTFVRNITDIDDKIIKRANENDETCDALTERMIDAMHEDEKSLHILSPDHEPRATQYIAPIIELIQTLENKGFAYTAKNGDVCFDVRKFKEYGKLSGRDLDKLIAGARIEVTDWKNDPLDFVLWKLSKPSEPAWDSPWGAGRPGWHIECSAMAGKILGQPFDIHAGGMDLKFPHHENEIAQSEAACDCTFANLWMHAGLLQVNGEKMSKSLGNFFTIRDVLAEHHPDVVRYFMVSGHYRSPVNYAANTLTQCRISLERLYTALRDLPMVNVDFDDEQSQRFYAVMDDDFNTPEAMAVLFDMAHDINRLREAGKLDEAAVIGSRMKKLGALLGILQEDPVAFLQGDVADSDAAQIEALIAQRNTARGEKNWVEADRLRDELTAMGVELEDAAGQTTWRRLRSE